MIVGDRELQEIRDLILFYAPNLDSKTIEALARQIAAEITPNDLTVAIAQAIARKHDEIVLDALLGTLKNGKPSEGE